MAQPGHVNNLGFAWIPEDDFLNHFAAEIDPVKARSCSRSSSHCTVSRV